VDVVTRVCLYRSRAPARRRSTASAASRLDLTGAALSVAALTVLTYTIIEAPDHGWLSATTLGLFAASAVLLAVFAGWAARSTTWK